MMIITPEDLTSLVERAMHAGCVALDTEFVWTRTYYPRLGLVQVGLSGEECFLVDGIEIRDLLPLGRLLADPTVVKILHDAQQDLTILRRVTGSFPRNVFDTRCAAGFAGLSSFISLRDLLREVVEVELDKTESRTDWIQRPLSDRQIAYAIEDVRHLPEIRNVLTSRARQLGLEAWLLEELGEYDDPGLYEERDPRMQFRRIKGFGRLSGRELAILRELAAWREEEARIQDRPRAHIVSDGILLGLARHKPQAISALTLVKGLSDQEIQRYGTMILEMVEKGLGVSRKECPIPPDRPVDEKALNARADFVLDYIKRKCSEREIDPSLVASRAEVTSLVFEGHAATPERHRLLRGWRRQLLGEELLMLLKKQFTAWPDPEGGAPQLVSGA